MDTYKMHLDMDWCYIPGFVSCFWALSSSLHYYLTLNLHIQPQKSRKVYLHEAVFIPPVLRQTPPPELALASHPQRSVVWLASRSQPVSRDVLWLDAYLHIKMA